MDLRIEVGKIGRRAVHAVDRAAGGGQWTTAVIERAAQGLAEGDRAVGVSRRWPALAARLRKIAREAEAVESARAIEWHETHLAPRS